MVLTAAQTLAFFEDDAQMGIPHDTVAQLRNEGITTVGDLADFDKDTLQQLADNLRRPGGRVADPNPGAAAGATIPTPSFVFGAKSQKRLLVATNLVRYFDTVGRDLTAANLQWTHVMKNFEIQWKALKDRKNDDDPDVPKITKALPIIKWTEAFQDFLNRKIGVRMIPLAYVTRAVADVPNALPPLATNRPHSTLHGSVEAELIARASHTHALFRDDNAEVYYEIEEATRGTTYAASIKPFQRTKNGRASWLAITNQYAGPDKWEAEIKKQEQLLHTRVWKGQSNFALEHFIAQHRNAFVSMQACAEHVQYQLPNEHSRVGLLLDAIQTSDAGLQAAMASVKTDAGANGMRNNFEAAAAHLLPYDPVAKKRTSGNKRGVANISGVEDADISATQVHKPSIGKTGVHLRYHTPDEYKKLTTEQRNELREWRQNNPDAAKKSKKTKTGRNGRLSKKQVSTLVTKHFQAEMKKAMEATDNDQSKANEAYLVSMIQKAVSTQLDNVKATAASTATTVPPMTKKVTLQSILKQARNGGN